CARNDYDGWFAYW
nr:immunoglobulin heavy chain junction region [Mus musculus]